MPTDADIRQIELNKAQEPSGPSGPAPQKPEQRPEMGAFVAPKSLTDSWREKLLEARAQGQHYKDATDHRAGDLQKSGYTNPVAPWLRQANGSFKGADIEMFPKELPDGALGWDDNGNPTFGGRTPYQEWQLQAQANRRTNDQITEEEASWDDWAAPNIVEATGGRGTTLQRFGSGLSAIAAGAFEVFEQTTDSIDYFLSGGDTEVNPAQEVLRDFKYHGGSALQALSSVAYQTKLGFGGIAHIAEEKFQFGAGVGDDVVHFDERWQKINDESDQFTVVRKPTELFWQRLGVTEGFIDEYKQGAMAGRMFYSTIWDNAVDSYRGGPGGKGAAGNMKKEEFLRQMKENPNYNPNVMVKKYENPAAEMWGEIIFDPLNVFEWGAKIVKGGVMMKAASKLWNTPMGKVGEVLKAGKATRVSGLMDDAQEAAKVMGVVDARILDVVDVGKAQTKLAKSKSVFQLTNSAKAHVMGQDIGQVTQWIMRQAKRANGKWDMDEFMVIQDAVAKTVGDPRVNDLLRAGKEVAPELMETHRATILEGLNDLNRFPGYDIVFSEPGTRAALFMQDAWSAKNVKKMSKLLKKGKAQEAFTYADDVINKTTKKLFPDIVDKGNDAQHGWKVLGKTHKYMQDGPYKHFNKFFSTIYLGLNPGFAARNFMQNTVQSLLDEGVRGVFNFNSLDNITKWNGGMNPIGSVTEFGTVAAGEAGHKVGRKVFGFIPTIGTDWAAKGEKWAGVKIYNKVYPDTMKRLLKKGLDKKTMGKLGFAPDEAKDFLNRLVLKQGDYDGVIDDLIMEARRGYTEVTAGTLHWSDEMVKWADDTGFTDPVLQILATAETKADAIRDIKDAFRQAWRAGDGVADEAAVLQADDIAAEQMVQRSTMIDQFGGDVMKADQLELNHYFGVNTDVWNTGLEASTSYRTTLSNKLVDHGLFDDAQKARDWMDEMIQGVKIEGTDVNLDRLYGSYPEQAKVRRAGNELTQSAVVDTRALKASKKKEQAALFKEVWKRYDMDKWYGPMPKDVSFQTVYQNVWSGQRKQVRPLWEGYRDLAASGYKQATEIWQAAANELGLKGGIEFPPAELAQLESKWNKAKLFDEFADARDIGAPLERALRDGDMKAVAIQFGRMFNIPLFSKSGLFIDKPILGVLNKQLKRNFKSLDDLTVSATIGPEAIETALLSYAIGETVDVLETAGNRGFNNLRKLVKQGAKDFDAEAFQSIEQVIDVVRYQDEDLALALEKLYKQKDAMLDEVARKGKRMSDTTIAQSQDEIGDVAGRLDDLIDEAEKMLTDNQLLESPEWLTKKSGEYTPEDIQEALNLVEDANPEMFKNLSQADAARGMAGSRQQEDIAKFYDLEPHDLSKDASFQATAKAVKKADKAVDKVMKEVKELVGPQPDQFKMAEDLVKGRRAKLEEAGRFKPDMAYFSGENMPTTARQWYELRPNIQKFEDDFVKMTEDTWGIRQPVIDRQGRIAKLESARNKVGNVVEESRVVSNQVALAKRNFILHDYNKKRNFDLAMSYVMPYHFWYTRTYAAWLQRTVTHPGTITAYLDYKDALSKMHADMPDWWKNNLNTNELLGIDNENPFYFNLEQTLNPLNGLTGLDFDDRDKSFNWFSSMMQDAGKFGPSVYTPIAWAIGGYAWKTGEAQAASKWIGRTIPQTQAIKALTAAFGLGPGGSGIETDPGIWALSGGIDPYESRRIGRALGWAVDEGIITKEQAEQAGHEGAGNEYYDNARGIAQSKRTGGQLSSFLFGAGFKARSREDMEIDIMDEEYSRFLTLKPDMDHEQVVQSYRYFGDKYPFFSTLQIARRDTDERDTSYAYSVLTRIPPGQTKEAYRAMGLEREQVQEFYEAKGIPEGWDERERANFVGAVQDVGTMLAIPEDATKDEWEDVRQLNKELYERAEQEFGPDVIELVDAYWKVYKTDEERAKAMREEFPVIGEYQDYLSMAKVNHPLLAKYYASFDQLRYITVGNVYDALDKKYGAEFDQINAEYNEMKLLDSKAAARFKKAHPEIAEYQKDKKFLKAKEAERLITFGDRLPSITPVPKFREDIPTPELQTPEQAAIYSGFGQEETPDYFQWGRSEWESHFTPALQGLIEDYALRNEDLSYQAEQSLNYQLKDVDIDINLAKQLIRAAYQGRREGGP